MGSGTTFTEVSKTALQHFPIPLPPLEEQRRIVARLDERMAVAERARVAADRIAEAATALKNSLLREILPLGQNLPQDWRIAALGEVCAYQREPMEPRDAISASLPYVGLEHIESNSGRIIASAGEGIRGLAFRFGPRHVLYGKLRPYLNKVALPSFDGRCSTEIIPLLPIEGVSREYLAMCLRLPSSVEFAMRSKTGSRMPRADMKALANLPIPLPPLDEQRRIVARLDERMAAAERAVRAARAAAEAAAALSASLLRDAFAGGG